MQQMRKPSNIRKFVLGSEDPKVSKAMGAHWNTELSSGPEFNHIFPKHNFIIIHQNYGTIVNAKKIVFTKLLMRSKLYN